MLRGDRFQQRAINLDGHVPRQQIAKQPLSCLLVDVVSGAKLGRTFICNRSVLSAHSYSGGCCSLGSPLSLFQGELIGLLNLPLAYLRYRQHMIDHQPLRYDRLEFVINQVHGVDFFARVALNNLFGQIPGMAEFELVENADLLANELDRSNTPVLLVIASLLRIREAPAKEVASLAADGNDIDVFARLCF